MQSLPLSALKPTTDTGRTVFAVLAALPLAAVAMTACMVVLEYATRNVVL